MSEPLDGLAPARLPFPVTRAVAEPIATDGDGAMPVMRGRFSTFDDWYEVDSYIEGHFLESVAPSAFQRTVTEQRSQMKVLYDHGQDPYIGNKVLGPIEELGEDARYVVPLRDTSYNRDLAPGLKGGDYGSSFRFEVLADEWEHEPKPSKRNPAGIPERTITEARVFEFGPVTFPANPKATVSARSTTDDYYRRARDPEGYEALLRSAQSARGASAPPTSPAPVPAPATPAPARKETPVSEYVTREEKTSRIEELRSSIARRAVEYDGELPPDVQAADDAENKEHDDLVRAVAAWDARQARVRELAGSADSATPIGSPAPVFQRKQSAEDIHDLARIRGETRSREEYDARVRENAVRSIEGARLTRGADASELLDIVRYGDEGEEGAGEIARRVLLTGAPAYRRAFNKYLRGEKDLWSPEEARAAALAVTGTTTTGGYAVPYVFDPTIIRIGAYTATNPFRQACRTETITNGNNWRTVTVGAVTTTYITEAGAATEQGPTFGQPTYTVQSGHSFATVSHETMQDRPDIGDELGAVFAESKATYEENQFAVGAGTTVYPMGMFTDTAYTNQDTAANDSTALADLTVCEGALPLRFRANAAWFMNRSTIRQLQVLDTTYRYFSGAGIQFQGPGIPNSTGPQIGSTTGGNTGLFLLGYPVWEVPSAVSTLTTDGAIIAVLCDPKTYIIVDRMGMSIEVIPNMLNGATPSFPTGQRGIYARFRNTAKPLTATGGISLSVQ